jgi:DNA-binding SARP family transcriptional activator/TolB-like protein
MADQGQSTELLWSSEATLELLGTVRLGNEAGDDLTPRARKTRALLALLALARGPVPRSRLIDLLWGDRGEEQGKASLRQALYELRGLAGTGYLTADRESVGLGPKKLASDLQAIRRHAADNDAPALARLLEAISPPLLGGLDDLTPELDDWLRDERGRIAASLASDIQQVGEAALAVGDAATARRLCDQLEKIDPLDERASQLGIRADLAQCDRAAAARRHARLAARLNDQLGISPSAETTALLEPAPARATGTSPPAPARQDAVAARRSRRALLPVLAALVILLAATAGLFVWLRPAAAATPSVAVLPFEGLGQKDDYFASGVSDEILNLLSQQRRLKVLGRMSAAQLADRTTSLQTAHKLGVGYLLDGSVRMEGTRVLVIARLTRVADGEQIWSERYERRAGDIFSVQGEIAGAVAARMARSLVGARPQETSAEVYDRYLAARQLLRERREMPLKEAERLLREAIALDPNYAPAFAELAQVTMLLADHPTSYGSIPFERARVESERLARRAIQLDPNLGDAHAALGFLTLNLGAASEPYFRRAVALSPQRPEFHRWHAQTLVSQDRLDEGIAEFKRAVEIDPLWGLNYDHLIGALYTVGRHEEARAYARRFLSLSTDERARLLILRSLANMEDRSADELKVMRALYRAHPEERQMRFGLASVLALLGEHADARKVHPGDKVGVAVLSSDWDSLAAQARAMGTDFWEQWGYWNMSNLLLASGHAAVLLELYDRDRTKIESGEIDRDNVDTPELIIALRRANRGAEANAMLARFAAQKDKLPDGGGLLGLRKIVASATVAALRGDRNRALAGLERVARERPMGLAAIPAISLRYSPALAFLANDPRLAAIDERVRMAVNVRRSQAGLAPIGREAWISDPKTLLTKN